MKLRIRQGWENVPFLMLLLIGVLLAGCADREAPVLKLDGPLVVESIRGNDVVIPPAIAWDVEDHDVSASLQLTGSYDKNRVGYYPLTYTASDKAGNTSELRFQVHVIHRANVTGTFASSTTIQGCPSSGFSNIHSGYDSNSGLNYLSFSPALGPLGSGGSNNTFSFRYNGDGRLSNPSGQIPCSYRAYVVDGGISPGGDTIAFELKMYPLTNTTIPYYFDFLYVKQ